jgi:demethylmenaquinone methyltransferase/2-methoxy-6-polyprenyl-1,4-benzoquinol methylase
MAGVRRRTLVGEGPLPEGAEKVRAVEAMFDAIAPRYEVVNRVLTFGLDARWRRRAIRSLGLAPGSRVLDLACGTGDLARGLAKAGLRPVGVDRSSAMLARARGAAPLVRGDAIELPFRRASLDGVVCGFALRNFVSLDPVIEECARVLRPGGRVALLEVSEPDRPTLRRGHAVYFRRVVPVVGGLLSDPEAYRYLPRSTAYLPPPPEMVCRLRDAGFHDAAREQLTGGIAQLFSGTRA